MGKKFRKKRRKIRLEKIFNIPVAREIKKSKTYRKSVTIVLTSEDQIVYIYEYDENRKTVEVVNVSYQILINSRWETIIRFDSEHGYLHGHRRISVANDVEVVFTAGVIKKGNPQRWLTWAVEYLKKTYYDHRRSFLKKKLS